MCGKYLQGTLPILSFVLKCINYLFVKRLWKMMHDPRIIQKTWRLTPKQNFRVFTNLEIRQNMLHGNFQGRWQLTPFFGPWNFFFWQRMLLYVSVLKSSAKIIFNMIFVNGKNTQCLFIVYYHWTRQDLLYIGV